jgi:hypothetical protein
LFCFCENMGPYKNGTKKFAMGGLVYHTIIVTTVCPFTAASSINSSYETLGRSTCFKTRTHTTPSSQGIWRTPIAT